MKKLKFTIVTSIALGSVVFAGWAIGNPKSSCAVLAPVVCRCCSACKSCETDCKCGGKCRECQDKPAGCQCPAK